VAIVGLGNWGKNLVRVFGSVERARLVALCDSDPARLGEHATLPPGPALVADADAVLGRDDVQAVVIATPPASHAALASAALASGRHVFVEKPMATSVADARYLAQEVERTGLRLMVGHILEYHPAFEALLGLVRSGELGDLRHVSCQRRGRGASRHGTPWWSLAPHDLSLVRVLLGGDPSDVLVAPRDGVRNGAVVAQLRFLHHRTARVEVSAIDAHKTRRVTVVGTRKVAVFDDQEPANKLRVYTRRLDDRSSLTAPAWLTCPTELAALDSVVIPLDLVEPLQREAEHFVDAVLDQRPVRTGAGAGLAVVKLLEAGQRQLDEPLPAARPPAVWDPEPQAPPAS